MTTVHKPNLAFRGIISSALLCSVSYVAAASANDEFSELVTHFVAEYETLHVPDLTLSYVDNFNNIDVLYIYH